MGSHAAPPKQMMFITRLQRRAARVRFSAFASVAIVFLSACHSGDSTSPASTIIITPNSASIAVDESTQFSALNAQGTVTWTSSNETIATVLSTGFATAHAPGTATISAKDSRGSTTATITVKSAPALVLSSNSVLFGQQLGGPDAPSQVVQLTDGGDSKVGDISIASVTAPAGQSTSWLTTTLSGAAAPSTLTMHATAGSLAPGVYSATISVIAVGAKNGPQSIVVTFTVTAPPTLRLSASTLSFAAVQNGAAPGTQTVNVSNSGGGTLGGIAASVAYTGPTTGWLSATLSASTGSPTLTVGSTIGTLAAGTYAATITVTASGASNSPQTVVVTFVVSAQPAINLSSSALTFNLVRGNAVAAQSVAVNNSGGGKLSGIVATVRYGQAPSAGWLSVTSDATSTAANLTVTPAIGALADGTYNATIDVSADNASNAPQSVAVTMVVASGGVIVLSSQSLTFGASTGGANPVSQVVNVTSSSGQVNGLTTTIIYAAGQPTGWLAGTLNGVSSPASIAVQPTTGALPSGTYAATVRVASTNAGNSPLDIAVSFTVSSTPAIGVAPATLSFSTMRGTEAATQVVAVSNVGGGNLTGLTASVTYQAGQPTGWLTAALSAATAPSNLTAQALIGALPNGTYNATISVASASAGASPRSIAVSFTIAAGPSIGVSTQSVAFAAPTGGASTAPQTFNITNTGSGSITGLTLAVAYTAQTGWLTASLNTTSAPSVLTLSAAPGSLVAGTYTATVSLSATGASNNPLPIAVTFTVNAPPGLVLGSNSSSTSATRSSAANPVTTFVAVTRSGGGSLTGLTATVSGSGSGWLTVALNQTTTPATLTITTNANSLTPSTTAYTATITVASPDASNSPQTIAVSFTALWSLSLDVYPAISAQCTTCHYAGGSLPDLSTSALFYSNLVNVATTKRVGYPLATTHPVRIVAGDTLSSYVVDQIKRATNAFAMPLSPTPAVPASTMSKLFSWIAQGARNN
jgi:uncharacterized membrane protein